MRGFACLTAGRRPQDPRRYRLQGAKTVVFYGLPDHAVFYSELINQACDGVESDTSEITAHALFSPLDALKLGRILDTDEARRLCGDAEDSAARFTFTS